ncbi:MAG TPA: arabinan endo-1,5-alpha-L-arabinosidase [Longimicrobiaceae bacterium]
MRPRLCSASRASVWSILAALVLLSSAGAAPLAAQRGDIRVHDPAIIKAGDTYYIFSTGRGIPIKRSEDLVTWEDAGRVFQEAPAWIREVVPESRGSLWAPDISYFNDRYHLYYSVSSFGSQRSAIGLATNVTLDPLDPRYRWENHGPVVTSEPGVSTFNAIDPNLALDADGQPWLSWGSFWGGIKMRRVDPTTGLLSETDTTLYSVASRRGPAVTQGPNNRQALEAPFIVRRGEYYYLFASYDMCCRGIRSSYNIRVGRSKQITGPYEDERGEPMLSGGGEVLLSSMGRVRGPGHNSILQEGEQYYLVHHFYDAEDEGRSKLQIRPLTWKEDGWPVAEEPLSPPE